MSEGLIQEAIKHYDFCINYARKLLKNEHDAEDIVQKAYTRIVERKDTLASENIKGLMACVVFNESMSLGRRRKIANISNEPIDPNLFYVAEPKDPVPAEISDILPIAVSDLPEAYQVLIKDAADGLAYRDIAAKYNLPIGTVMSRLFRARKQLQEILAPFFKKVA